MTEPPEAQLLSEALPEILGGEREVAYIANPGNTGDAVISRGVSEVFSRLNLVIEEDGDTVLIAGGGNLVPRYHNLREILQDMPRRGKRIVILPSTALGCFGLLREFEDLTLLAREAVTWHLAREAGVRTLLCHDAAFDVDYSPWVDDPEIDTRLVLWNFRKDGESAGGPGNEKAGNRDLSEEFGNRLWDFASAREASSRFISEINRYRNVHTDRLHVAIVAACLGKRVFLHPNDYHKNRSMYENSLSGFPNVTFIDGPPQIRPRAPGFESFEEEIERHPERWTEVDPATEYSLEDIWPSEKEKIDFRHLTGPSLPPSGVLELSWARVSGRDGLIQTADGRRIIDLSWPSHLRAKGLVFPEEPGGIPLRGRTVSIASPWGGGNYAHFILDVLGRIGILREAGIRDEEIDHYLCPRPPTAFAGELLRRTGIPREKIRWLEEGDLLWVEHLKVASFPGAARVYSGKGIDFVAGLGGSCSGNPGHRRIFVDRPGRKRDLTNREEIVGLLKDDDFETFGEPDYHRADEIFSEAEIVVGVHGAGLANIIFCRPGTKVIEIVPSAWPAPFFRSLAFRCGLDYTVIPGSSAGHSGDPDASFLHACVTVEMNDLQNALA